MRALLPSPLDVPAIEGTDPTDESKTLTRKASTDEPFAALVGSRRPYELETSDDPFGLHPEKIFRILRKKVCNRHCVFACEKSDFACCQTSYRIEDTEIHPRPEDLGFRSRS